MITDRLCVKLVNGQEMVITRLTSAHRATEFTFGIGFSDKARTFSVMFVAAAGANCTLSRDEDTTTVIALYVRPGFFAEFYERNAARVAEFLGIPSA